MHGVLTLPESFIPFDTACNWIALLTQPGSERKACIWLRRRQFKPYWARYKGTVKLNRHRKAMRWRSVIPGYLFIPLLREHDRNWKLIEQTPGVHGRMNNSEGGPKLLSQSDILSIRGIEEALNSSPLNAERAIPFKVGQRVRVINDLYWQLEGPILAIDKNRRIVIEVLFLGRPTRMTLPVQEIEAV